MTGTIGFWLRIGLIGLSGWLMNAAGVSIYDAETETISIHVDHVAAVLGAFVSFVGWKGWHSLAKREGGKT